MLEATKDMEPKFIPIVIGTLESFTSNLLKNLEVLPGVHKIYRSFIESRFVGTY